MFKLKKNNLVYLCHSNYFDIQCNRPNSYSYLNFLFNKISKSKDLTVVLPFSLEPIVHFPENYNYIVIGIKLLQELKHSADITKLDALNKLYDLYSTHNDDELKYENDDFLDCLAGIRARIKLLDKTNTININEQNIGNMVSSDPLLLYEYTIQQKLTPPTTQLSSELEKLIDRANILSMTLESIKLIKKNKKILILSNNSSHYNIAQLLIKKFNYKLLKLTKQDNVLEKEEFLKKNHYANYPLVFGINPGCFELEDFDKF
jgi:hypothetical protein